MVHIPSFFLAAGASAKAWLVAKYGVKPIAASTTVDAYVRERLWPSLDGLLVTSVLAVCLPLFFLVVRCVSARRKTGRGLLYVGTGLLALASVVAVAFSLLAVTASVNRMHRTLPIVATALNSSLSDLAFLEQMASTYSGSLPPSFLPKVHSVREKVSGVNGRVQHVLPHIERGLNGFQIACIAILSSVLLLALVSFCLSSKCVRGLYSVLLLLVLVAAGAMLTAFMMVSFVSVDGLHYVAQYRVDNCPVNGSFTPEIHSLQDLIQDAKAQLSNSTSPTERQKLQTEINDAQQSIGVLDGLYNCTNGYALVLPGLRLTDEAQLLVFFSIILGIVVIALLTLSFLLGPLFGCCYKRAQYDYEELSMDEGIQ